jgi:hypothetical protein
LSPEGYSLRQGFAISKLKRIGVWEKMPPALKHKAKEARGAWTGCLKLTQKDSVSDDAWETIAKELSVPWRYAAKPAERACDPAVARG